MHPSDPETQFGVSGQRADPIHADGKILARHEPAHVAPQEPVLTGRMRIGGLVRMGMMMAMMGSPPQWAALRRRGTEDRKQELHDAAGAKRAMREVTVIEGRNGKHAHNVQGQRHRDRLGADANPRNQQAAGMNGHERHLTGRVDLSRRTGHLGAPMTVEPGAHVGAQALKPARWLHARGFQGKKALVRRT